MDSTINLTYLKKRSGISIRRLRLECYRLWFNTLIPRSHES